MFKRCDLTFVLSRPFFWIQLLKIELDQVFWEKHLPGQKFIKKIMSKNYLFEQIYLSKVVVTNISSGADSVKTENVSARKLKNHSLH